MKIKNESALYVLDLLNRVNKKLSLYEIKICAKVEEKNTVNRDELDALVSLKLISKDSCECYSLTGLKVEDIDISDSSTLLKSVKEILRYLKEDDIFNIIKIVYLNEQDKCIDTKIKNILDYLCVFGQATFDRDSKMYTFIKEKDCTDSKEYTIKNIVKCSSIDVLNRRQKILDYLINNNGFVGTTKSLVSTFNKILGETHVYDTYRKDINTLINAKDICKKSFSGSEEHNNNCSIVLSVINNQKADELKPINKEKMILRRKALLEYLAKSKTYTGPIKHLVKIINNITDLHYSLYVYRKDLEKFANEGKIRYTTTKNCTYIIYIKKEEEQAA